MVFTEEIKEVESGMFNFVSNLCHTKNLDKTNNILISLKSLNLVTLSKHIPIAGRLKHFVKNWEIITSDKKILKDIQNVEVNFQSRPIQLKDPRMTVLNQKEKHLMSTEVREMLTKEVIVPVKPCGIGSNASVKLKTIKPTCNVPTFQNGGLVHDQRPAKSGRFNAKNRYKGGIFSFVHQSKPQKISEVQMGRNLVRVHSPILRVSRESKVVHQNNETSNRYIAKDGCSYDHISRRHTPHGRKPQKTRNSQKFNFIPSPKIRISDKLEKIKLKSNSKDRVSGFSDKFSRNDVLSTNRKGISDKNKMQRNVKCKHSNSKAISTVDRKAVILYASNISSKFANANIRKRKASFGHSFKNRQYFSNIIHKQNGGHKIKRFKSNNEKHVELVSGKEDKSHYRAPPRERKSYSRLALEKYKRLQRLESRSKYFSTSSRPNRSPRDRSVCCTTKLQTAKIVSWKPDPISYAIDAFLMPWTTIRGYAFPPFLMIGRCLSKARKDKATLLVIAPAWQAQPWYPMLLEMLIQDPIKIQIFPNLLMSPQGEPHPLIQTGSLNFVAWKNTGDEVLQRDYQKQLQSCMKNMETMNPPTFLQELQGKMGQLVSEQSVNPFQVPLATVIEFLTKLLKDGLQYRTINTYRSKNYQFRTVQEVLVGRRKIDDQDWTRIIKINDIKYVCKGYGRLESKVDILTAKLDRSLHLLKKVDEQVKDCKPKKCVIKNVALRKTNKKSSWLANTRSWGNYICCATEYANDGNATTLSHTNYENFPYWWVDLGHMYDIMRIEIINRSDSYGQRLHDVDITVGPTLKELSLCAHYKGPGRTGERLDFYCNQQMSGRYVKVTIKGKEFLQLSEVMVFAPEISE
ncbi:unnamed protein product [Mytilus coruscus]|uniref:Fucolectin tachylectin-4 pentraxin-1 domain-containing protein n=1 Tax=Mytilus coruscus TaxID=42192 RepID=A0A6J8CD68_MYTCO|nr:unnamed protein product [Mytilus coruscus]